ncbi:MAG: endolytic transglycosylase MltG [Tannerella sp.]|nr:endolytic transglycosylase MltG [Tannerella sp.]
MSKKKLFYILFISLLVAVSIIGVVAYYILYMPNFEPSETEYVYIQEDNKDFDALCDDLQAAGCRDIRFFKWLAELRKYPQNMKAGRYAVTPGMSNNTLLNRLRRGQQTPVKLTFNNMRLISDLIERLSEQLMVSGEELLSLISDETYCESLGFNTSTVKTMFIPNTYEVYWTISAEKLMERMKQEYDRFWTAERRAKAEKIGLTPVEISILASIVEEETAASDEYPVVAGLYINRLHKGMLLQADPTVKYAVGDFSLQRILNVHTGVDSPYNTYRYEGLPPGPIRIPSPQSIDAVLNYTSHNYLYMCAKEDFSGRHNFATTMREHNINADKYRAELNRRGIR